MPYDLLVSREVRRTLEQDGNEQHLIDFAKATKSLMEDATERHGDRFDSSEPTCLNTPTTRMTSVPTP